MVLLRKINIAYIVDSGINKRETIYLFVLQEFFNNESVIELKLLYFYQSFASERVGMCCNQKNSGFTPKLKIKSSATTVALT